MLQRMAQQSQKNCAEYGIQLDNGSTTRKILIHQVSSEKNTSFITDISHFKQEGNSTRNLWHDITHQELCQLICKGEQLITIHARGENGLVHNPLVIQKSSRSILDVNNEVHSTNYKKWLCRKQNPNFKAHLLIVGIHAYRIAPHLHRKMCESLICFINTTFISLLKW